MTYMPVPVLVRPDATRIVDVSHDGRSYRVLFYGDGEVRFEHRCDRGERGVIVCAPLIQTYNGAHRIVVDDPLTIQPSILCSDCGTHGFVTDGQWVPA